MADSVPVQPIGQGDKTLEIVVILDRSGSMATIKNDMERGLNHFVREQQALPGLAAMTLVQFGESIETVLEAVALDKVPPITIIPAGYTPLLDAIGTTIERWKARTVKADKVVCMIVTDGEENASKRFSRQQVKQAIEEMQGKDWVFMYLGANVDAFHEASAMGVPTIYTANLVGGQSAGAAFVTNSAKLSMFRNAGLGDASSLTYTDTDRSALDNTYQPTTTTPDPINTVAPTDTQADGQP